MYTTCQQNLNCDFLCLLVENVVIHSVYIISHRNKIFSHTQKLRDNLSYGKNARINTVKRLNHNNANRIQSKTKKKIYISKITIKLASLLRSVGLRTVRRLRSVSKHIKCVFLVKEMKLCAVFDGKLVSFPVEWLGVQVLIDLFTLIWLTCFCVFRSSSPSPPLSIIPFNAFNTYGCWCSVVSIVQQQLPTKCIPFRCFLSILTL